MTTNKNNSKTVTPCTLGCTSRNLWQIYNLLPDKTIVDFEFSYLGDSHPQKTITISKDSENELLMKSQEKELYDYIREFGFDNYYIHLQWNFGFGNSVLIDVSRAKPQYEVSEERRNSANATKSYEESTIQ